MSYSREEQLFHNKPLEERIDRARGLIHLKERKESFKAISDLLLEQPDDPELLRLAGDALCESYPGLAASFYERVLRMCPEGDVDEAALSNLGHCIDSVHPHVAKQLYYGVLQRDPNCKAAAINLAAVCASLGEHEDALAWGKEAQRVAPDDPKAYANVSLSQLATGNWVEGWRNYRYLFGEAPRVERCYKVNGEDVPRYDHAPEHHPPASPVGTALPKRLVVYGEQGIGDEILFLSMLPQRPFCEAGYIETTRRLEGLVRRSFPEWIVYGTLTDKERDWAAREGITHKLEMGALGEWFGLEPFRLGRYLETDPVRVNMWRNEFRETVRAGIKRRTVGLAWTGGKWDNGRAWRSVAPTVLRPMIDAHPDINFVSLEYLPHDEVSGVQSYPWCTGSKDMDNVAALIDSLDLVISVTTTAVDIAGSLGKECWAMVPRRVSWRYGTEAMGEDMWFYRSVKCYRQKDDMDWSPVVERISEDLHKWKGERKAA